MRKILFILSFLLPVIGFGQYYHSPYYTEVLTDTLYLKKGGVTDKIWKMKFSGDTLYYNADSLYLGGSAPSYWSRNASPTLYRLSPANTSDSLFLGKNVVFPFTGGDGLWFSDSTSNIAGNSFFHVGGIPSTRHGIQYRGDYVSGTYAINDVGIDSYLQTPSDITAIPLHFVDWKLDTISYTLTYNGTALLSGNQNYDGTQTFLVEGKDLWRDAVAYSTIVMWADTTSQSIKLSIKKDPYFPKEITLDSTGFYKSSGDINLGTRTYPWDTVYTNNLFFPGSNYRYIGWDKNNNGVYDVKVYSTEANSLTFETNGDGSYLFQPIYFKDNRGTAVVSLTGITTNYDASNTWRSKINVISDSTDRESHISLNVVSGYGATVNQKEIVFDSTGLHHGISNAAINIGTSTYPFDTTFTNALYLKKKTAGTSDSVLIRDGNQVKYKTAFTSVKMTGTDTTGIGSTANIGKMMYYNGHFYGLIAGSPPTWKQLDN